MISKRAADFYQPGNLGITVDASAFYPSIEDQYGSGNLPFLRVGDVNGFVDVDECIRIPHELTQRFPTLCRVRAGDIVFTKGGAIDRVGLVSSEAAVSRDLIFLTTSRLSAVERQYLFAYFCTPLFRRMLVRSSSQTAQPHLTVTLVRELPIFKASNHTKDAVSRFIALAFSAKASAARRLREAENALLLALGMQNWSPPNPLSFTASWTTTLSSGRLDAQFFSPRIRALLDLLGRDNRHLRDVARPRHEAFQAQDCETLNYIEISDLDGSGETGSTHIRCSEAPSRATWYVRCNDIITSTVRPIRRLSAQISAGQDGYVCSSGFVVIHPKSLEPELLLTYLRLPAICELLDLYASASMYPAVTEDHILGLPIPIFEDATASKVVEAVRQARDQRRRAANLLESAKRAVEIAIEEGEKAALRYLKDAGE